MSFGSSLLRTAYKLSGAKKAFALPEDELLKAIEKANRGRGFFMPTDHKAHYEKKMVKSMSDFNDIGISRELDWPRIKKLLTIGLFASVLHLAGDLILGWGVEDDALEGVLQMLSVYTSTSDSGLFAAALLGLFGVVLRDLPASVFTA